MPSIVPYASPAHFTNDKLRSMANCYRQTNESSSPSSSYHSDQSGSPNSRKRVRAVDVYDDENIFRKKTERPKKSQAQSAAHELKKLRKEAEVLEKQMQFLRDKWRYHLPDDQVLYTACQAAKSKWISLQAEQLNKELKERHLQQQLYLASIQTRLTSSPVLQPSRSREIFDSIHSPIKLRRHTSEKDRLQELGDHIDAAIRVAPALMTRLLDAHVAQATFAAPYSHTSIMADANYSYVSNVLAWKICNRTYESVYNASVDYLQHMSGALQRHLGVTYEGREIHDWSENKWYRRMTYTNGPHLVSCSNTFFGVGKRGQHGVVMADFVDEDEDFPVEKFSVTRDTTFTTCVRHVPAMGEEQEHVLVQRVVVTRYNLHPNSQLLHHDLHTTLSWLNGDLFIEMMCRQLDSPSTE